MTSKEFQLAYRKLNSAQKQAVDTIEGPVMVIAGPGTGKTQILTLRIANILVKTDTPASGILALTFTEAGQKAMKLRLRHLIGSRADEVGIFTYHSFASSVIDEYPDHFPHLFRARQLSEFESERLIREILEQKKFVKLRPLGRPDLYLESIIKNISNCRKEAWTPDFIKENSISEIEKIKNDPASLSTRGATKGRLKAEAEKKLEKLERTILFADIYQEYEIKKKEKRFLDFDDLIFELLETLKTDDLLLRLLQERYLYLLVDEHQDTNNAQNLLIKQIADFYEEPNLFVVGDEKQAIYRFQGASVKNFLEFQKIWPRMKIISLVDNYRSSQSILDASLGMIENNYQSDEYNNLRVRLLSARDNNPEPVSIVLAGNHEISEEYLAQEIKIISSRDDSTVAVIVRTNNEVTRILEVLESAGIPASAERGTNIFAHPIGVIYFKLLEFLIDESNLEALGFTIAGGLWDLGLDQSVELLRKIKSGQNLDLIKFIPALGILKKNIAKTGTIEFLILAGELSGLTTLIASEPLAVEVWRSIIALAEDIVRSRNIEDSRLLVVELLEYCRQAEKKNIKISAGATDAKVVIMTAHGSKGLEYDYVFIPYANEESWLTRRRNHYFLLPEGRDEGDEIKDARRLFYVALTRARQQATVIVSLADSLNRPLTALRFIDELDQQYVARTSLPRATTSLIGQKMIKFAEKDKKENWEYTKQILLDRGLSVTALNHFIRCPNEFFYKSILRLPEPPSPSSEKGNAMHEALSAVWFLSDKSEKEISQTILQTAKNYLSKSLLSVQEKTVLLDEFVLLAPQVAKALIGHFSQAGKIFSEKWVETVFDGYYKETPICLRLHGKLDVVIDTTQQVLVYDYKTKKKMSENDIRGKTISGDGSYFRQMIFYKMLLQDNYLFRGKEIIPSLIFVQPDEKGRCPTVSVPVSDKDLIKIKQDIQSLIESVWSGRLFNSSCADVAKCKFCALRRYSQFGN